MKSGILDIHHHGLVAVENAVTSFSPGQPVPKGDGKLSVGIHPWESANLSSVESIRHFIETDRRIVAVGETGLDILRGADIATQTELLRQHIRLSEEFHLPLILHSVRTLHLLLQLHKQLKPTQPWAIHGFRGNPIQARQLTDRGIYLSYGNHFNTDSILATPQELILAETDESITPITEIISSLPSVTEEVIVRNTKQFLYNK